jgi:hypothetical protein
VRIDRCFFLFSVFLSILVFCPNGSWLANGLLEGFRDLWAKYYEREMAGRSLGYRLAHAVGHVHES